MAQDKNEDKKPDKDYEIVVNGEKHVVDKDVVTFEQVVSIAYPTPPTEETRFTVTFFKAHKPKEGTLTKGQSVEVKKNGTVFNVKATIKS